MFSSILMLSDSVHPHGSWGILILPSIRRGRERFIPTGVGNTDESITNQTHCSVHPHGRGEYRITPSRYGPRNGSSPRAWGILSSGALKSGINRFIPTGVGNTFAVSVSVLSISVHPHGRVGIQNCGGVRILTMRFIPTGVGNTSALSIMVWSPSVHPHGRGEYSPQKSSRATQTGSSPRAWGIPLDREKAENGFRFIPTGVGNTPHGHDRTGRLPVHPHGRGEYPNRI